MSLSRPWLALVLALFCLPLFVGLGDSDLDDDEASYSFAVDRILEVGEWLTPHSGPHDGRPFLEIPPLKFWIVAAPIRLGLLPHNEFGLRFWDALFGGAMFLYVFALGSRLAGPVCGATAVLVLFGHWPLLVDHGLRSNGMDAALALSYCGGIWHFFAWASSAESVPRRRHAVLVGLYFILGFLTAFAAALFLPLIVGMAGLLVPEYRRQLVRDWRLWCGVCALVLALSVPWFVYASVKFGSFFWRLILADSVYTGFFGYLNPSHVHPWYYYLETLYRRLADADAGPLVFGGLAVLIVQTIRRRSAEGVALLLWVTVPLAVISASTSKGYHHIYPFLPPLALGAGYLAGLVFMLAPAPVDRALDAVQRAAASFAPKAVAALALAGANRRAGPVVALVLVVGLLPLSGYYQALARLEHGKRPLGNARDCVLHVQGQAGADGGLQVEVPDGVFSHSVNYYFRSIRPWQRADTSVPASLDASLNDPSQHRPILIWDLRYQEYRRRQAVSAPAWAQRVVSPMLTFADILLLLPGPYAACSADAAGSGEPH